MDIISEGAGKPGLITVGSETRRDKNDKKKGQYTIAFVAGKNVNTAQRKRRCHFARFLVRQQARDLKGVLRLEAPLSSSKTLHTIHTQTRLAAG